MSVARAGRPDPQPGGIADRAWVDDVAMTMAQYVVTEDGFVLLAVVASEIEAGIGFQHDCVVEHHGRRWGPYRGTERQVPGTPGQVPQALIRSNAPVTPEPISEAPA